MENSSAHEQIRQLFAAATPVLRVHSIGGRRWKRDVASGPRIGPWLPARYEVLDESAWNRRAPCLYLVAGKDGGIRYVGKSANRLKDRWRLSPALDAETMAPLPTRQLFHSQCWKHIESEAGGDRTAAFEVRVLTAAEIGRLRGQTSGDEAALVEDAERWICQHGSPTLACWNKALIRQC